MTNPLLNHLMHTPVSLCIYLIELALSIIEFNKCFILLTFEEATSDNPSKYNIVIPYVISLKPSQSHLPEAIHV